MGEKYIGIWIRSSKYEIEKKNLNKKKKEKSTVWEKSDKKITTVIQVDWIDSLCRERDTVVYSEIRKSTTCFSWKYFYSDIYALIVISLHLLYLKSWTVFDNIFTTVKNIIYNRRIHVRVSGFLKVKNFIEYKHRRQISISIFNIFREKEILKSQFLYKLIPKCNNSSISNKLIPEKNIKSIFPRWSTIKHRTFYDKNSSSFLRKGRNISFEYSLSK